MNCLRRSALVWLAGGLVAIVSLEASADGIWSFPEGILSPDLEVVQDGKSDYVVVVAGDAIPSGAIYAAKELVKYLKQMTGVKLEIVKDDAPPRA